MGRGDTEKRTREDGHTDRRRDKPRASDPETGAEDTEEPREGEGQKLRDKDPEREGHRQE